MHPTETMFAILTKEPEPLPAEIPQRLREIVYKALEKDEYNGSCRRSDTRVQRKCAKICMKLFSVNDSEQVFAADTIVRKNRVDAI